MPALYPFHGFRALSLTVAAAAVLAAGACTSSPIRQAGPVPEMTYEHLSPIAVNVARIDYDSQARSGARLWDLAEELPTPPDTAVRRYVASRYQAAGQDGILSFTLQKADIFAEDIPNANSLLSYLPAVNDTQYTFEIMMDVASRYLTGLPEASNSLRFVRKVRIPADATLAYREARLQRTLEEMIRDIDAALLDVLSDQYRLVSVTARPATQMPVRTSVPETQTNMGERWERFKQGVRDMSERARDSVSGTKEQAPEPVDESVAPPPI